MRKLILIMLGVAFFATMDAQRASRRDRQAAENPVEATTANAQEEPESLVVTEECLMNLSLFNESAKNRQYADALEPWNQVFNNCPSANRAIYAQGRQILHWELSQQKDDASYRKVFDKLMLMYDKRIKYFGDDPRYPTAWILGIKALDYMVYAKHDELMRPAYEWLEQSIDGMGENTEIEVLRQFVVLSDRYYSLDNSHGEKYIMDYLKANAILEVLGNGGGANEQVTALAQQYKNGLDIVFAQSGAADCNTLDALYAEGVRANRNDFGYLSKILSFYRRVRCTESEVYFSAAVNAHKIQPSAESASALAAMSFSKEEYEQAITYYEEATNLSTNNSDKADYQFTIAQIYLSRINNYPRVKTHALRSLELQPGNGRAYLIIGLAYANAKIYDDPILQKTVYWAAVDKFNRAKQVDPSLTDDANRLINTYTRHFPSKEDIFFKSEMQDGRPFQVGGWINESTICR